MRPIGRCHGVRYLTNVSPQPYDSRLIPLYLPGVLMTPPPRGLSPHIPEPSALLPLPSGRFPRLTWSVALTARKLTARKACWQCCVKTSTGSTQNLYKLAVPGRQRYLHGLLNEKLGRLSNTRVLRLANQRHCLRGTYGGGPSSGLGGPGLRRQLFSLTSNHQGETQKYFDPNCRSPT